jgi:osmoprotectant transport system permease protein
VSEQLALLPGYLTAHLQLSLLALGIGVAVSVPLGIWITRRPSFEPAVLGAASVIQTIPSLALLAIMVPTLAAIGAVTSGLGLPLRGIGFAPALTALALYGILPILRNTVTGIAGVDPALVEAARGVGMSDGERLARVELPLALPVIVAGLRTSAVWIVGTATLSTPVGATSLGNFIFSGLQTRNQAAVLVGCIASAGLALVLDQLIRGLETGLRERRRRVVALAASGLTALTLYALGAYVAATIGQEGRPISIGSKAFTEQYILAEMLAARVEDETGLPTHRMSSLGSSVAFNAMTNGDLDLYVDYTGTLYANIMKRTERIPRREVAEVITRFLEEEHGAVVAASLGFENTYALGMRRAQAEKLGIDRISQLTPHAPNLEIGGDYEFFQRPEWAALVEGYGLEFRVNRTMDPALMYQAVAEEEVDVISAYSTDGRIAANDLVLLLDDRGVIPPYDTIVVAGARLRSEHPEVLRALTLFEGLIDAAAMQRMNRAVDHDGRAPSEVARSFLAEALDR